MSMIAERMVAIMNDVEAISKGSFNDQQGFRFRGIEAVMNELHGLFARHGVFILTEVLEWSYFEQPTSRGGTMFHHHVRVKFNFTAADGSMLPAIGLGEAADAGDKSVNKALSTALKYVLTQGFLIPTALATDADTSSYEAMPKTRRRREDNEYSEQDPPGVQRNTVEQQKAALADKVTAARTAAAKRKPPPGDPLYTALAAFEDMKKRIGEGHYYRILRANGREKSNEIADIDEARKIYLQMVNFAKEMDAHKAAPEVGVLPVEIDEFASLVRFEGKVWRPNAERIGWVEAELV